jgi:hypothetical protein
MKKFTAFVFLVLVVTFPVLATDSSVASFQWFNSKSLYRQSPTDIYSGLSTIEIILLQTGQPRSVRVMPNDGSKVYEDIEIFTTGHYVDEKLYLRLKTGIDVGLLRLSLFKKNAQLELAFSGALNAIFQGFGGADNLGFDGIFFFGPQIKLLDRISLKCGLQHYSGHYGDETIENYQSTNSEIRRPIAFTRDNNLFFGIQVEPIKNLSLHFEATRPGLKTWMEPAVHIPSWSLKPSSGEPFHEVAASGEGINPTEYPDSYKAWTVQGGISYDLSLSKQFGLALSGDVKLHQDGMTKHQAGAYSDDNPWEMEYTIGGGIVFIDPKSRHAVQINLTYHNGRLPLLNYFYQRTSYISLAVHIG